MTEQAAAPIRVERIQMEVPPFWHNDPTAWFLQLEHSFSLSGVTTDETKYSYVVTNLEAKVFSEVRDIITNPPTTGRYQKIKEALISRLGPSQSQNVRQLLEHEELGDRKPSQFLRHLHMLAGSEVPMGLLKTIWLHRLPLTMQAILATQQEETLEKLGQTADVISTMHQQPCVSRITQQPVEATATPPWQEAIQRVEDAMNTLTTQVQKRLEVITAQPKTQVPTWRRSTPPFEEQQNGLCWYHAKFGRQARRCRTPCNFQSSRPSGNDTAGY